MLEPQASKTGLALLGASPGEEGLPRASTALSPSASPRFRGGLSSCPQGAPSSQAASPQPYDPGGSRICSPCPQHEGRGAGAGQTGRSAEPSRSGVRSPPAPKGPVRPGYSTARAQHRQSGWTGAARGAEHRPGALQLGNWVGPEPGAPPGAGRASKDQWWGSRGGGAQQTELWGQAGERRGRRVT